MAKCANLSHDHIAESQVPRGAASSVHRLTITLNRQCSIILNTSNVIGVKIVQLYWLALVRLLYLS